MRLRRCAGQPSINAVPGQQIPVRVNLQEHAFKALLELGLHVRLEVGLCLNLGDGLSNGIRGADGPVEGNREPSRRQA
jgi:hypothetical protein